MNLQQRPVTPVPVSLPPRPPAPASHPAQPSTSGTSLTPAAPVSYVQAARGPVSRQEQSQPFAFRPAPRASGKVEHLLLADSVTRALVYPRLEAPTGSTIRQVNTYSSQYDERAHKPHRNVAEVLRQELEKKKYHTVLLGAPTVDITNQDVSFGIIDDNVAETVASSCSMVESAEYTIKSGRAGKVILLQHPDRFDTPRCTSWWASTPTWSARAAPTGSPATRPMSRTSMSD